MRALLLIALMSLMACQQEFNEGLSGVALIQPEGSPLSVSYTCEEGPAISVIFYEKGGTATVAMIGIGQQVLYSKPADTGYHYSNEGFDLKGDGPVVSWSQVGGIATTCTAVGDRV